MKLRDLLLQTTGSITQNKVRSGLTILGIVIGISSVILLLALGNGAQASIQDQIASIGSQVITVSSKDSKYPLHFEDKALLSSQIPRIIAISNVLQSQGDVIFDGEEARATLYGVDPVYKDLQALDLLKGSFFSEEEVATRERIVILGSSVEEELSSTSLLGKEVRIAGYDYLVIGVFDSKDSNDFGAGGALYMPFESYLTFVSNEKGPTSIALKAATTEDIPAIEPFVQTLLHRSRNLEVSKDVFSVFDLSSIVKTAAQVTQIFTYLLAAIGSISLFVGGIGIMNMMLTTVTERTQEIGLRKALGARARDIVFQFLVEAILLTLLGGIVGILIGAFFAWVLGKIIPDFTPIVTLGSVLLATIFSGSVGLFFGYYPSQKAAKLNPIEALRHE